MEERAQYDSLLAGLDAEDDIQEQKGEDSDNDQEEKNDIVIPIPPQVQLNQLVDAEMTLWDDEPVIRRIIEKEDGTKELSDPLGWWKNNENRFPRLAKLAKRYLAIQATSAPAERLFSVAGLTIANGRAGLLPDNAAMLIFLHENLKKARAWRLSRGLADIA